MSPAEAFNYWLNHEQVWTTTGNPCYRKQVMTAEQIEDAKIVFEDAYRRGQADGRYSAQVEAKYPKKVNA